VSEPPPSEPPLREPPPPAARSAQGEAFALLIAVTSVFEVNSHLRQTPLAHVVLVLALAVLWRPGSVRLFAALLAAVIVHCGALMPYVRNHWLLLSLLGGGWLVGIAAAPRAERWSPEASFARVAPLARWGLLVLYACTVLSKLNTDYFDPRWSCAGELYELFVRVELPFLPSVGPAGIVALAVLSVVVEVLVPIGLLFGRTRWLAVVVGAVFHFALGAKLPHISTFVFALYLTFLPREAFDASARALSAWPRARYAALGVTSAAFAVVHLAVYDVTPSLKPAALTGARLGWQLAFAALIVGCAVVGWRSRGVGLTFAPSLRLGAPGAVVLALVALFGAAPYLGTKTQLAFTMYSNLRTEGPAPNHLFVPVSALRVVDHERALVAVAPSPIVRFGARDQGTRAPFVRPGVTQGAELVPLLQLRLWVAEARAEGAHHIHVEYTRDGVSRVVEAAEDDPVLGVPVPWLVRKLVSFRPVSAGPHQACFW
jgi:hypothetical protein